MPKQNNKSQVPQQTTPPPELITQFFNVQAQEIALRTRELDVASQQNEHNKAIAEASITANVQDRENERAHRERKAKLQLFGILGILIIVIFFLCFALFTGKEAVAIKVIEVAGTFLLGFAGGYGYRSAKKQETSS
jgi:hypothetical protein